MMYLSIMDESGDNITGTYDVLLNAVLNFKKK